MQHSSYALAAGTGEENVSGSLLIKAGATAAIGISTVRFSRQ